jgi:hypothetical protein
VLESALGIQAGALSYDMSEVNESAAGIVLFGVARRGSRASRIAGRAHRRRKSGSTEAPEARSVAAGRAHKRLGHYSVRTMRQGFAAADDPEAGSDAKEALS